MEETNRSQVCSLRLLFSSKDEFISFQFSTSVLSSDLILSVINARISEESLELLQEKN